jgi:hypothetical protein
MNYIKKVILNKDILDDQSGKDRLGILAIIKVKAVPNKEWSLRNVVNTLSNIYYLMGYQNFTFEELKEFSETGESWVFIDREDEIRIQHKYWSYQKMQFFKEVIESLSKLKKFKIEFEGEEL